MLQGDELTDEQLCEAVKRTAMMQLDFRALWSGELRQAAKDIGGFLTERQLFAMEHIAWRGYIIGRTHGKR